jgi:acyl-coenzyme A thioesterase PaaI-like protein
MDHEERRRFRWAPNEAPATGRRATLHQLAGAIRRSIAALVDSEIAEADLEEAAELAETLAALLEAAAPAERTLVGFAESANAGMAEFEFDSSPLMGPGNPVAPPLVMRVADDHVEGTATFGQQYEGPPGHVHGGFVAAAFDEVLGMAQSLAKQPGMTGRLVVHYRKPTPLNRELRFRGQVDRVEGRKIFTSGTLHAGDDLCAEAEGLFISVDFSRLERIARES